MSLSSLAQIVLAVLVAACCAQLSTADLADDISEMRVFELRKGALACPVILIGEKCPEANPLYYFKCCGDLSSSCCFRLQDWVIVVLAVVALLVVISIIVNFIRCLFCY